MLAKQLLKDALTCKDLTAELGPYFSRETQCVCISFLPKPRVMSGGSIGSMAVAYITQLASLFSVTGEL